MEQQISIVRRKIGDRPKAQRDIVTGNSVDRVITLQHQNVFSVVVQVGGVEMTTGFEVQAEAGRIIFETAPAEGASVAIDYLYAAYTDQEITDLLDETGSIDGTVIACLEELTMETARFYDFTQGETSEKRSQVFDNLMKLLADYKGRKDAQDAEERRGSGMRVGKRHVGSKRPKPFYPSPSRRY